MLSKQFLARKARIATPNAIQQMVPTYIVVPSRRPPCQILVKLFQKPASWNILYSLHMSNEMYGIYEFQHIISIFMLW